MMCSVLQPDLPHAYVCAESYIFDVTEWFNCQVIQIFLNKKSDLFFTFFFAQTFAFLHEGSSLLLCYPLCCLQTHTEV
jgi:hypothetical protein